MFETWESTVIFRFTSRAYQGQPTRSNWALKKLCISSSVDASYPRRIAFISVIKLDIGNGASEDSPCLISGIDISDIRGGKPHRNIKVTFDCCYRYLESLKKAVLPRENECLHPETC